MKSAGERTMKTILLTGLFLILIAGVSPLQAESGKLVDCQRRAGDNTPGGCCRGLYNKAVGACMAEKKCKSPMEDPQCTIACQSPTFDFSDCMKD
jgi:hypothetical protein